LNGDPAGRFPAAGRDSHARSLDGWDNSRPVDRRSRSWSSAASMPCDLGRDSGVLARTSAEWRQGAHDRDGPITKYRIGGPVGLSDWRDEARSGNGRDRVGGFYLPHGTGREAAMEKVGRHVAPRRSPAGIVVPDRGRADRAQHDQSGETPKASRREASRAHEPSRRDMRGRTGRNCGEIVSGALSLSIPFRSTSRFRDSCRGGRRLGNLIHDEDRNHSRLGRCAGRLLRDRSRG
jgi:hypothetical protein